MSGFGARLRRVGALLGDSVHTRLELFAAEVDDLIAASLRSLLLGLAAVGCLMVASIALIAALALMLPEPLRAPVLAGSGLVLGVLALALSSWASRLRPDAAFAGSLNELRRDLELLRGSEASHRPPTPPADHEGGKPAPTTSGHAH